MKRRSLYFLALSLVSQEFLASVLVGKTEGTFSLSPFGAATYSIPITVQKGMSDFVPEISLSYNSQTVIQLRKPSRQHSFVSVRLPEFF